MRITNELLARYPIISRQVQRASLAVVLGQLEACMGSDTAGDIVEFGCYIGTTSLFIRRLLDCAGQQASAGGRQFHVYDSFAGLPPKSSQDQSVVGADFVAGELAVSKKQLLAEFQRAELRPPVVHKAWFGDLTGYDVPEQIAFAFLDGDFYQSILDSLRLVWPRLSRGGVICFDDYQRDALPGVERAVRDYFQGMAPSITVSRGIGILKKGQNAA